ncbi:MAG: histidine kinase dimerization/phospho-acceptor domain-containing protein [Planctomycetota bacterium]
MMPPTRVPLRSRLVVRVALAFVVASVAPIVGLGLATDARLARQLEDEARRRHLEVARNAEALVDVWLEGVQSGLSDLAIALDQGLEEERHTNAAQTNTIDWHLRNAMTQSQNSQAAPFQELQVYCDLEDDGSVAPMLVGRLDLPGQAPPVDDERLQARGRSEVVQQPLNDARPWIGSNFEQNAGRRTLSMSVPMKLADDVAGALVGDVETDGLADLLEALAGDRYGLEVRDALGDVLVDTFARRGGASRAGWIVRQEPLRGGEWSVAVGEPASVVHAPLARLRARTLWATGIAAVLAVVLSVALSLRITRPVEALEARAMELAEGDLSVRTGRRGNDEIGRLGRAFDEMAGALEQLDRAKSDFVFTVSHELRTPLTSLRLTIANLLDGVNGELSPAQERSLRRVAGDLEGLSDIVQDLLRLARLEAGAASPEREPVELASVARRVARGFEAAFERKGVRLEVLGDGVRVRTDAALVQRVLANLVQNALQFSPNGGTVTIEVEPGALRVVDGGPGFPDAAAGAVGEPFEKAGRSTEGYGLGLSIAKRIAKLLGARLELGARADGARGASAAVTFRPEDAA